MPEHAQLAIKLKDLLLFPLMVNLNVAFADSYLFIRRLRIFFSMAIATPFIKVEKKKKTIDIMILAKYLQHTVLVLGMASLESINKTK